MTRDDPDGWTTAVAEQRLSGLRAPARQDFLRVDAVVDWCLGRAPCRTVLDVGMGTGLFTEAFAAAGCTVAGADLNPAMIRAARRWLPEAPLVVARADALPFSDAEFDLVFLGCVLHEVPNAVAALREALRASRRQVGILEFPCREQPYGPPLARRMPPDEVVRMGRAAGGRLAGIQPLAKMVLYFFTPKGEVGPRRISGVPRRKRR